MADELVFYTNPMSRGRIVTWILEEIGQPYRTELLGYGTSMKAPEYLAINPMGKVPAIKHGETIITEAGAICAYLADAFPQAGLAPALNSKARGPYYRWLFFGAGCVEPAISSTMLNLIPPPDRKSAVGFGSMEDVLGAIEGALPKANGYLAGDTFSAADLYIASQLGFGMRFGAIEKRPAFEAYVARMQSRPAYLRATEIDDGLAAAQQKAG